ncbi:MAG: exo-alpha-sialidase [Ignavibacteria bacterium]
MKHTIISILFLISGSVNIFSQWQPDVRLTNNPAYSSTYYNSAWSVGASGNFVHAVWTDLRDNNNEIYYKRSTDGGSVWGADTRLTVNSASSWNTSLTVSGSAIHVIWIDDRDGNWEIYYKNSTDDGLTWNADTRVTNNSSSSEFPSVAVSGNTISVVWTDNRDGNYEIYCKRSTDSGLNWSAETRLTNNSSFSLTPSVSATGSVVNLVWRDNRDGNYEIYYKRSADGGSTWSADTRLTNDLFDSGDPSVSASGSLVYVNWLDSRDENWKIFGKRSTDGGLSWGADTPLTASPADPAAPSVWVSGSAVHIAWQDYRDGNYEIYYKRSTDAGSSWGTDTRLSNNSALSEIPSLTVSGQSVHVIWTDERDGNREIYYKRDPAGNPAGLINISTEIPKGFSLSQNYPNPFNPTTKIKFSIPFGSVLKTDIVRLTIYDNLGREIETLVNQQLAPGTYEVDFVGSNLATGTYYYRFTTDVFSETKKMLLVK